MTTSGAKPGHMSQRLVAQFRSFPWSVAAVMAAAVFVRLPLFLTNIGGSISGKVLWYDEAYSAYFASRGLADAIRLSGYDTTPGLFVALLHFWMRLFGTGTPALALFSVLLSAAGVLLVYFLGKEYFGRRAGVLAALAAALSPLHLKFATEVRAYNLLFCLAVLSLIFLRRFLERRRRADGAGWIVFSVLGLYAHYTYLFFFILQNLFVACRLGRDRVARRTWLLLLGAGAAACLPLPLLFRRWADLGPGSAAGTPYLQRAFGHGSLLSVPEYFAAVFFGERAFYPSSWFTAVIALGCGAAAAAGCGWIVWRLWSAPRRPEEKVSAALLGWLVFGGIAIFMIAGLIYDPKYYLVYAAPAAALAGAWLARWRGWHLGAAIVALTLVMFMPVTGAWEVTPDLAFRYYAPAFAAAVEERERPGDLLLLDHYTDILFRRYYGGHADVAVFFPRNGANVADMYERFRYFDYDLMTAGDLGTLQRLAAGRVRIWTVDYYPQSASLQDPGGLKRRWLSENYLLRAALEFPAGDEDPERQRTLLLLYEKD